MTSNAKSAVVAGLCLSLGNITELDNWQKKIRLAYEEH